MAMDTEIKRSSALNFGSPSPITLPPANDRIYLDAREHLLGVYAFPFIGSALRRYGDPDGAGVGIGVGV